MTNRLSPKDIKQYLDAVIETATGQEPLLAKRLKDLRKWISEKKEGLLMSKPQVLDLLTEIILDSELWLNLLELSPDERKIFDENYKLNSAEKFWIDELFPSWFREKDPQSPIWKQKIMAGKFSQNDEQLISELQEEIENKGGNALWRFILDLSMATDLLVVGHLEKFIGVQLTTSSGRWLQEKKSNWEEILKYWGLKRGLLVSYSPNHLNYSYLAGVILQDSDNLPDICYIERSFSNK